jgi:hypothetical protein
MWPTTDTAQTWFEPTKAGDMTMGGMGGIKQQRKGSFKPEKNKECNKKAI